MESAVGRFLLTSPVKRLNERIKMVQNTFSAFILVLGSATFAKISVVMK